VKAEDAEQSARIDKKSEGDYIGIARRDESQRYLEAEQASLNTGCRKLQ